MVVVWMDAAGNCNALLCAMVIPCVTAWTLKPAVENYSMLLVVRHCTGATAPEKVKAKDRVMKHGRCEQVGRWTVQDTKSTAPFTYV
jgi:hypothetical protein